MNTSAIDVRKIAAMRLILAASGLLVIFIDPSQPDRQANFTYFSLGIYTIYSAALYYFSIRQIPLISDKWAHWADIAWYILLISLSNGTSSIFFFGLFLAVVSASFRWGFHDGLRTTLVATLCFTVISVVSIKLWGPFELDRFLLRAIYLLVIGYMIAYWGGQEITMKRRLELLNQVSALSNPRFGVERTVRTLVEQFSLFYAGDTAALVVESQPGSFLLYRTGAGSRLPDRPEALTPELGELLLQMPEDQIILYNRRARFKPLLSEAVCLAYDPQTFKREAIGDGSCERIVSFFGCNALMTVPMRHVGTSGRLFIASNRNNYNEQDARFVIQALNQVTPVIHNIYLVDRLASDAAEAERQKIARDIHDSVIQPYIGLQMALGAAREKLARQGNDAVEDIDRIYRLAQSGVIDLRGFVQELTGERERQPSLLPAVRRYTDKFSLATGISVDLNAPEGMYINDRLAAEVFQIITEGLANIRKHTSADQARIALREQSDFLLIQIENDASPADLGAFLPRSISGRASALGGGVLVEQIAGDKTVVTVRIPL